MKSNKTIKRVAAVFCVLCVLTTLAWQLDQKYRVGVVWRSAIMKWYWDGPFSYKELVKDPAPMAACVDLGAFKTPLQNLRGISTLVIMEDRSPKFFLSYNYYQPEKKVPLNRHGPSSKYSTQEDLHILVKALHDQDKKALIGFWGFWGDFLSKPTEWLKRHPELKPRRDDESDIGNPFTQLVAEKMSFAEYIGRQYQKLHRDFGFDGLFLGDGLSGFRAFFDPARYRDKDQMAKEWADFYQTIAHAVHASGGELWAYDCLGFEYEEAKKHGADYRLLAEAGLDVLVFQTYPTAWAYYLLVPGKENLKQDVMHFLTVKTALEGTSTRLFYSLELGDEVEGWLPMQATTRKQMRAFSHWADGKFLVWGNGLIAQF